MISDATPTPASDVKLTARVFLRLANGEYQARKERRGYFAMLAKRHGLTHQEIANEYGVTEGAVRAMIQRAGK